MNICLSQEYLQSEISEIFVPDPLSQCAEHQNFKYQMSCEPRLVAIDRH